MNVIWAHSKAAWKRAVALAPAVLAGVSGYLLFLVIVPFFVLDINNTPYTELASGGVCYQTALGLPAAVLALILALAARRLYTYVWLFSLINFVSTKRWYVLLLLLLAPLPIAYVIVGPYADSILAWIGYD